MVGVLARHVVVGGLHGGGNVLAVVAAEALVVGEALVAVGLLSSGLFVVVSGDVLLSSLQVRVGQVTNTIGGQ